MPPVLLHRQIKSSPSFTGTKLLQLMTAVGCSKKEIRLKVQLVKSKILLNSQCLHIYVHLYSTIRMKYEDLIFKRIWKRNSKVCTIATLIVYSKKIHLFHDGDQFKYTSMSTSISLSCLVRVSAIQNNLVFLTRLGRLI